MKLSMTLLLILVGCGKATPAPSPTGGPASAPTVEAPAVSPEAPAEGSAPSAEVPATTPADAVQAPAGNQELYEECKARLEQPEAEGECTSDADCAPAGCSSEKCITKVAAADLMGTCEILPCFQVVETCRCDAGSCRWTVKP